MTVATTRAARDARMIGDSASRLTPKPFRQEAKKFFGSLLLGLGLLWGQFFAAGTAVGITLADALDNGTLTFTSRGSEPAWSEQTTTSYYGGSAAQSATISHSQSTSLVTTVTGPGLLRFYWKVSSEAKYDLLRVFVDNVDQGGGISGEVNWAQRTIPIPAGSHEVRWTYSKDSTDSAGSDTGWVDKVEFISVTPSASFLRVAASDTHTLAVRADGTLWAWGDNTSGRLGDGTTIWRAAPVRVGADSDWTSVSSFYMHSAALKSDGTLWSWGANNYGELGDGTTSSTPRTQPGQVGSASNWTAVAAGNGYTVALKSDGTLWAWGNNSSGQLGNGTNSTLATPTQITSATDWVAVSAGNGHTVALKTNGTLWAWGNNSYGQLGGTPANNWIPTQVGSASDWVAVAAGGLYTIALKSNGTLWAWGANHYGQLGKGTTSSAAQTTPTQVGTASDWVAVDAGYAFAVAVKSGGTFWAWGYNAYGQLGDGTSVDRYVPTQVGTASHWWSAAGGGYHTVGLATDGPLWAWGANDYGQVGDGTYSYRIVPAQVGVASNWTALAAGDTHTVALKADGTLWAWGNNGTGQLGDGTGVERRTPTQIGSATNWSAVAAGVRHTLALKSDGTLWAWGSNAYGQIGNNLPSPTVPLSPIQVGVDNDWIAVAAGDHYTLALKSNHTLWAWGYNLSGRLGVGSTSNLFVPFQVGTASDWAAVSAGYGHTVALKLNGTLWTWGSDSYGQLGDGSALTNQLSPVQVGTSTWSAVSAGGYHTLAIRSDGTLWAWGNNGNGQLGNGGAPTNSPVPVQVGSATNWTAITAGNYHSIARQSDGTLWGWGSNITGAIGDGTNVQKNSPAQVDVATDWALPVARGHSAALKSDGTLWTWGYDAYGQLGHGGNPVVYAPVRILRTQSLTVSVAGNGVVTSNPAGINCGASCVADFGEASQVTLTATPSAGETFLGWGGACSGTGSCAVTVDAAKSITASFSDTLPDAMIFAERRNVALGEVVTSGAVTIGGIDSTAQVSVANGEYSIGCTGSFTAAQGIIGNGQTVCVRHTASTSYETATETVLSVGLGQGIFRSVTVAAPDTVPNTFSATLLYVPNPDANSVTVIDPTASAVVDTIKVGLRPVAVTSNAGGSRVYVANRGSNTVSVIDTSSNRVIAHLASGVEPLSLAESQDGSRLYMGVLGCLGQSWIYEGQTTTGTIGRAIPIAFPPYQIAADAAGRYVYAAGVDSTCATRLAIVDQANNYSVVDNIQLLGAGCCGDPALMPEADVRALGPKGIAVKTAPAGNKVYVSSTDGVRVYSAATNAVSVIGSGRSVYGAALNPDGSRFYVVEKANDKLLVIDTSTDAIVAEVAVADQPSHIAVNADGSRVYVLSYATGVVETRDALNGYQLLSSTSGITAKADLNGQFAVTLQTGFVPKKAAALGAETVSNWITVSGINQPVNVNLDAGWYRINDETDWTAAGVQRQVNNGDRIQVKFAAPAEADATFGLTLNVGGITVPFWVTTPFAGVEVTPMTPPKFTVHSSVALASTQISKDINMANYVPAGVTVPFAIYGGMYSRNGGPFTAERGFTSSTDVFVLKAGASSVNGAVQSVLLVVNGKTVVGDFQDQGGATAAFAVTSVLPAQTAKADTEPAAFAFDPVVNATPNQPQTSNTITVSGIDGENLTAGQLRAPISVANGRYKINAGAFRSDDYFVQNGDTVVVEHTPTGGTTWAELTIGTLAPVRFEVTTVALPTFALSVTNSGGGTVTSGPAGINCGTTCSATFTQGTVVTLTATPNTGFSVIWSGACTGTGACSVTMDAAKSVTASFADTQAPTVPEGLTATVASSSQINLAWTASTDNVGVSAYKVYRGGTLLATLGNVTSYSDTGLTGSTAYSYTVAACDVAGNCSTQSAAASGTTQAPPDTTAPSVPTGLVASAASPSQINLSWTASTDNVGVTQYKVYRSGALVTTLSGAPPMTSYSDTGLTASTVYSYTVAACDAAGNCSAQSAAASATTQAPPDTTAPSVPTGLAASAVSPSQVNLSWTASTDNVGVTQYKVYRGGTQIAIVTAPATSHSDTELNASTSYSYTVAACDAAGNCSAQSTAASATTQAPPDTTAPSVPTGLVASAASPSQINLSWTASTDNVGVTQYKVYRGGTQIATVTAPTVSYSDTGLSASTSYSYAVVACDTAGNCSAQSTSASATTQASSDTAAPSVPTGLVASAASSSQINLSWTASTDNVAVMQYKVYRGGTQIAVVTAPATSYGDTGLAASTAYSYTVAACDLAGNCSAQSTSASATTQASSDTAAPSVPTGLVAGAASSSQINLSWTASTDNVAVTQYKVYRGGTQIATVTAPAVSYSDTGLTASTSYSYTVAACDAAGNCSAQSTSASATTLAPPDTTAPSVPTGLAASAMSASQINLSWTASTDNVGVTQYKVFRSGALVTTLSGAPPMTSYSDTALTASTVYSYTVAACDAASNCSAQSTSASATTQAPPDTTAPSVPTGLTASVASASQINLGWTASTDAVGVTQYRVYRDGTQIAVVTAPAVSYSDTGLAASTSYSYTVAACDAAGNCSAQSSSASATTQASSDTTAPSVPTGLSATALSATQIALSWTASTDNVGVTAYKVYRGGTLLAGLGNVTSYSDTGLTASTAYSYTVAACDAASNCSAQSASASANTPAAGTSSFTPNLESSWNLLGNSLNTTLDVAATFGNGDSPVTGITENIASVWKWNAVDGRWAFYSPQLSVAGIASYAAARNYDVLATIGAGEGYWVNAINAVSLPAQSGSNFTWSGINFAALVSGFNLIATASSMTPSQFNTQVSMTPPSPGVIPTDNFTSLWAWDALEGKWYFYSPILESSSGLAAVKSYADGHNYLHFQDMNKTLGVGVGFWVNRP